MLNAWNVCWPSMWLCNGKRLHQMLCAQNSDAHRKMGKTSYFNRRQCASQAQMTALAIQK